MPKLYKKQKLCGKIAIEALFAKDSPDVSACLAFPLRAAWRPNGKRLCDAPLQFMISVPKRRLRHAVDRVKMRRRIREAFRLCQNEYPLPDGSRLDVAFVYIDNSLQPYAKVERAMHKLMAAIAGADARPHDEKSC